MKSTAGSLRIRLAERYYTLDFESQGWLAAHMVQYLDRVYESRDRSAALVKMLGLGLRIHDERPPRRPGIHWVDVDLEKRLLESNSEFIRKAVDEEPVEDGEPYSALALKRVHQVLDAYDFTVKLF
ncbi:MAG TPA: hypothetical protein VLV83_02545 [Acidobacteriota bacterium]|nr:hypothetical protein [Acidobacteriota bacterium]